MVNAICVIYDIFKSMVSNVLKAGLPVVLVIVLIAILLGGPALKILVAFVVYSVIFGCVGVLVLMFVGFLYDYCS